MPGVSQGQSREVDGESTAEDIMAQPGVGSFDLNRQCALEAKARSGFSVGVAPFGVMAVLLGTFAYEG